MNIKNNIPATEQALKISLGQSSKTGPREQNEDFYACVVPASPAQFENKGIAAIVADGVSGSQGGKEAAQYAVGGFFQIITAHLLPGVLNIQ